MSGCSKNTVSLRQIYLCLGISRVFFFLIVLYSLIPLILVFNREILVNMFFQNEGITLSDFNPSYHNISGLNLYLNSDHGIVPVWILGDYGTLYNQGEAKFYLKQKNVIFFMHGVKNNRYHQNKLALYRNILKHDVVIITFDYKGFSEYPGQPSGAAVIDNIKTVYNWMRKQIDQDSKVIWWGHSAGCGFAAQALADEDYKIDGFVFESGFSTLKNLMVNRNSFKLLFSWWSPWSVKLLIDPVLKNYNLSLNSIENLKRLTFPIYHIHSVQDRVVPMEEAKIISYEMNMNNTIHYSKHFLTNVTAESSHYISANEPQVVDAVLNHFFDLTNTNLK